MPHPLTHSFTLANVWCDLCRLAGEPVPGRVAAILDPPRPACPLRAVPKPGYPRAIAD